MEKRKLTRKKLMHQKVNQHPGEGGSYLRCKFTTHIWFKSPFIFIVSKGFAYMTYYVDKEAFTFYFTLPKSPYEIIKNFRNNLRTLM